ncbi:MAG: winged helix-turn-helix transcriptional regulator [Geobacter sp.]|nr:winged helix-turn-helix transcriptional regulator [Geobacter sp.]
MNAADQKSLDTYKTLQLLSEIDHEREISQRELSRRLGIALGLVNSYLKNLVSKGFIRIKNFPRNRYAYLLTPTGVAEKSRLAYEHLSYFTSLYTIARQDYQQLFQELFAAGVRTVAFCGVDEVAEIAYLSIQGTGLQLCRVMDDEHAGETFFGLPVLSLADALLLDVGCIVVTSLKRGGDLRNELLHRGVDPALLRAPGAAQQEVTR